MLACETVVACVLKKIHVHSLDDGSGKGTLLSPETVVACVLARIHVHWLDDGSGKGQLERVKEELAEV